MEQDSNWQLKVFQAANKNKLRVIKIFKVIYLLIIGVLFIGAYVNFYNNPIMQQFFYDLGIGAGRLALVLLLIVITPGILGRLGINIKVTFVITIFRRYLGILMFLTALTHASLVRLFPYLAGVFPFIFPPVLFESLGFIALFILFWIFLTANDFSILRLGVFWKWLHRLVYVVMGLVAFHTALQRISIWSILIWAFVVLEVLSFLVYFLRKKQTPTI